MAEDAAEGFGEILLGEDVDDGAEGEDGAIDDDGLIAKLGH